MNQKQITTGLMIAIISIVIGILGLLLPMLLYTYPILIENMTKLEYVMYVGAYISFPLIVFGIYAFGRISIVKKEDEAADRRKSMRMLGKVIVIVCIGFAIAGFLLWLFYPNSPASPFDTITTINDIVDLIVFSIISELWIWTLWAIILSPILFMTSKCAPNEVFDPETGLCTIKEKKSKK